MAAVRVARRRGDNSGSAQQIPPLTHNGARFKIVKHTIAPADPAFLIVATRVRAEQHAARFQSGVQFQQHAQQFLPRDMKQRGVGEHTIEMFLRQCELKKILPPYFAPAMGTRHGDEMLGAFQTDRILALLDERFEVAGPQPKSSIVKGGLPSMRCNSASMFWLTL